MASISDFDSPAPATNSSLAFSKALFDDLLTKELDARASPADAAKVAAFAELQGNLPAFLVTVRIHFNTAVRSHVGEDRPLGWFQALVEHWWRSLRNHPRLHELTPAFLNSSLWLKALSEVFTAASQCDPDFDGRVLRGSHLVQTALLGIAGISAGISGGIAATADGSVPPFSSVPPERVAVLVSLLRWWGDDVCTGLWGVTEAWTDLYWSEKRSPLEVACIEGLAAFVPLVLEKGCRVNGDYTSKSWCSPAVLALECGHVDVVEALMAHGLDLFRPYDEDGIPTSLGFFIKGKGQVAFLSSLLDRHPEIITASAVAIDNQGDIPEQSLTSVHNLVHCAIQSEDPAVLELVLSAGAPVEFDSRSQEGIGSPSVSPSLSVALQLRNPKMIEVLISKGKAAEDWRDRYDEAALAGFSRTLAELAVSSYPTRPSFTFWTRDRGREASKCVDAFLASGIVCPWGLHGGNSLLWELYSFGEDGNIWVRLKEEADALAVLKRYHAAGFDVVHSMTADVDIAGSIACDNDLQYLAIHAKHLSVVDWAIEVLKVPVEPCENPSLLSFALASGVGGACAPHLLEKHNVRAAYPEKRVDDQPVVAFMHALDRYSEEEATAVISALLERELSLFDLPCFTVASFAAAEATTRSRTDAALFRNPLVALPWSARPKTLEFLLKNKPPGVAAMANRSVLTPDGRMSPAQYAAHAGQWECLDLLLRYTDARVTDAGADGVMSALELVRRADAGTRNKPPRALVVKMEVRAQKEVAAKDEKAKTAAASQAAGAVTNAFEEPPAKPLTEREARRKAKKKAAKKKARAKKRAIANAGAGSADGALEATGAEGSSDDDDSDDGPYEEEPDDNLVDSRNAPSLDLMLEQMGLKEKS